MARGRSHIQAPAKDVAIESPKKSQSSSDYVTTYARQRHGSRLLAGEGNILLSALKSAGISCQISPLTLAVDGKSEVVGKIVRINQPILIVIDETEE